MKSVRESEASVQRDETDSQSEGLLGKRLVDSGTLSAKDVGRIVVAQREQGLLFGEAALSLGLVTESELQRAGQRHRPL